MAPGPTAPAHDEEVRRAHALQAAGRLEEAAQAFQAILAAWPASVAGRVGLGIVALSRADHAAAEPLFRQVIVDDPLNMAANLHLAMVFQRTGRTAGAQTPI